MFEQIRIAPSLLSADFMHLGSDVERLAQAGAGFLHVDVMDGHFVPNLTMGVPVVKALKGATDVPLDVHLMISNPLEQLPWYLNAGADMVTIHIEALKPGEFAKAAALTREAGARLGVSLKPATPVSTLADIIQEVDMVLIMSVEPGFSGQGYIPGSEQKVAEVAQLAKEAGCAPLIEVDGGIGEATAPLVAACGADVLVCGNAVCAAPDPAAALQTIQAVAQTARLEALAALGETNENASAQSACECEA